MMRVDKVFLGQGHLYDTPGVPHPYQLTSRLTMDEVCECVGEGVCNACCVRVYVCTMHGVLYIFIVYFIVHFFVGLFRFFLV